MRVRELIYSVRAALIFHSCTAHAGNQTENHFSQIIDHCSWTHSLTIIRHSDAVPSEEPIIKRTAMLAFTEIDVIIDSESVSSLFVFSLFFFIAAAVKLTWKKVARLLAH